MTGAMAGNGALIGREAEGAELARLLDGVRNGESRALLVRGEAGVGKTALLDAAVESAADLRVLRTLGVESEMELPFAGLHQLCRPLLGSLDGLPEPQLEALEVAFGLREGAAPDRFLVALAALTLFSAVAEEQPLLCVVDDAQWLDEASTQALAFVARRLLAESIAIVFVSREQDAALASLPELEIGGIGAEHARTLLAARLQGRLDERVRERIVAETRGNPLALLELPESLTSAELAGGFDLPDARSRASRTEQSFLRRFRSLPAPTQLLLLTAAAEPVGDVALLWRAAEALGIGPEAAVAGESEGLIELGARARFRHPLVRSAIYHAAPREERERVHGALAEATDPEADPDRRAWHRAHAAPGLDESVAAELERSAERAQRRGGIAAAAAFLRRAAELTPDPVRRGERAMAAAQAKVEAGDPDAAQELAETAELAPLDDLNRARMRRLRAQIGFATRRGSDAAPALLEAARLLIPLDPELARETGLEALAAGLYTGSMGDSTEALDELRAAPAASPPRPTDLLFDGLAARVTEGYAAGAAPLREALDAFLREEGPDPASDRWLWLACRITSDTWDEETWEELAERGVSRARAAGALDVLPIVAIQQSGTRLHAGRFSEAMALGEEAAGIIEAAGSATLMSPVPMLSAYRGRESETLTMIEAAREEALSGGRGTALSMVETAGAILCNGLGRYEEALAFAERAFDVGPLARYAMAAVELVEAAARCGRTELAEKALEALAERTRLSGTDWALGLEARSRALLNDGPEADGLYAEAVERHLRTRLAPHRARTQLLYGEWLRRGRRRVDARAQLRAAHETFTRIGAEAFAERAGRELQATGETVRKRSEETADVLTAQEAQIARMARDGLSNTEIGAQLFISPRTVQYHLHKVFPKLGITSRRQLGRVAPSLLNPS